MNCLEARRTLLAHPAQPGADIDAHVSACSTCGQLAQDLHRLDREITDAASIRPPDGLAQRILLARRPTPPRRYAIAAAIVAGTAIATMAATQLVGLPFVTNTIEAVGPAHPAAAAISEVAEDAIRPGMPAAEASEEVDRVLRRLGLRLKPGEATVQYVGKCTVAAGDCDHIVLRTGDAQASVMIVPEYRFSGRMIVSDRRMIALVHPRGTGGYIVIADKPETARRIEKLFVRS
jgi:hypothetical protein